VIIAEKKREGQKGQKLAMSFPPSLGPTSPIPILKVVLEVIYSDGMIFITLINVVIQFFVDLQRLYCIIIAFIAQKEDIEAQGQEDKSPSDGAVSQFSFKHTANPTVPQDVNQNSNMDITHFCPEDTKF